MSTRSKLQFSNNDDHDADDFVSIGFDKKNINMFYFSSFVKDAVMSVDNSVMTTVMMMTMI